MANEYLTVTLTGRPPAKIKKADWPHLASASDNDRHGAQIGNRADWENLVVRQHSDGRAMVYAIYGEFGLVIRGGELLEKDDDLVKAIGRVAERMAISVGLEGRPGGVFRRLANECIAALPAVEL